MAAGVHELLSVRTKKSKNVFVRLALISARDTGSDRVSNVQYICSVSQNILVTCSEGGLGTSVKTSTRWISEGQPGEAETNSLRTTGCRLCEVEGICCRSSVPPQRVLGDEC